MQGSSWLWTPCLNFLIIFLSEVIRLYATDLEKNKQTTNSHPTPPKKSDRQGTLTPPPPPTHTHTHCSCITTLDRKRTSKRSNHVQWVEDFSPFFFFRILLFFFFFCFLVFCFVFCFVLFLAWKWMCEWMSLQCHSCTQTLDRGERCLGPDLQCPR